MRLLSATYKITAQIADLFLPPGCCVEGCDEMETEVHHKDCNPFNNDPRNLERRCKKHHAEVHKTLPNINMAEVLVDIKEIKEEGLNVDLVKLFNTKMNPEV